MKNLVAQYIRRSIKLMDDFIAGDFDYLELSKWFQVIDSHSRDFSVYDNSGRMNISLLISKNSMDGKSWCSDSPTMTELRELKYNVIYLDSEYSEDSIFSVIKEACKKWVPDEFIALPKNITLRAQTSYNRMNYGCEWVGGGYWEEKTLYGDTTDFYIVGIILSAPYKFIQQEATEILESLKVKYYENIDYYNFLLKDLAKNQNPVYNKHFGEGFVKSVEEKIITVAFQNRDVRFVFPDVYFDRYLISEPVNDLVKTLSEVLSKNKKDKNEIDELEKALSNESKSELYHLISKYR